MPIDVVTDDTVFVEIILGGNCYYVMLLFAKLLFPDIVRTAMRTVRPDVKLCLR